MKLGPEATVDALLDFDSTRDAFAFKPVTPVPADDWRFRVRRRLGTVWRAAGRAARGGAPGAGRGRVH